MNRKQLLSALGTFFSKNFQDDPFMTGLLEGTLALQKQVETNWEELALSAYRKHIPIHHTEHVYTFTIDPAKRNDTEAALPRFNDPLTSYLDAGTNPNWLTMCERYGVSRDGAIWYSLSIPGAVWIEMIVDDPVNPTIELLPGVDFELGKDSVRFMKDPCADGKVKEYFLINVKQDLRWIYKHFGYLLNLESESSELYRSVVDSIFNAYIDGASAVNVFSILAEVTGNIIAKQEETIQSVTSDAIVTNKSKYPLLPGRTSSVQEGDKVMLGDSLTKEFTPIHINQLAQKDELAAVLLPARYLGPDYFYGIAFINENVPIFQINGQSRFYVGGSHNDVERFWRDFEVHCQRHNTTVNEVISLSTVQSRNIINPYHFFTEHIGRYHYTLLSVEYRPYPTGLTLDKIPLRRLMPPWSTLLIQQKSSIGLEISIAGESIDGIDFGNLAVMEGSFGTRG